MSQKIGRRRRSLSLWVSAPFGAVMRTCAASNKNGHVCGELAGSPR